MSSWPGGGIAAKNDPCASWTVSLMSMEYGITKPWGQFLRRSFHCQRFPGHARQAAYIAAQCQAAGNHLGRYVVVVDDDIDPTDLNEVIWAIGTKSNPEKDIDIMRNSYSSPLDPIYPNQAKIFFGSRAIIDACKPYDWLRDFPRVVQSSREEKQKVIEKWPEIFK